MKLVKKVEKIQKIFKKDGLGLEYEVRLPDICESNIVQIFCGESMWEIQEVASALAKPFETEIIDIDFKKCGENVKISAYLADVDIVLIAIIPKDFIVDWLMSQLRA